MISPWDLLIVSLLVVLQPLDFTLATWQTNMVEPRRVLVELFEWKWTDVAVECERFLGPRGFGGVQISPPNEHAIIIEEEFNRPWWERYQPVSYNLESRGGTESQFRNMVHRCNNADVRIYVDTVINHMAIKGEDERGSAGSFHQPKSFSFPAVPYSRQDFNSVKGKCRSHDGEIHNYQDPNEVRNCNLDGLLDLDISEDHVRSQIVRYLNKLIDLGVAGFRVDASKHMWPDELREVYSQLNDLNSEYFQNGSKALIYQEVIDNGGEAISAHEYTHLGLVTEFQYGHKLAEGLRGLNPLKWYQSFGEAWNMLPSESAIVFLDNHDTQRMEGRAVINYQEPRNYKVASAFMLAYPYGTVRLMSSYYYYDDNLHAGPPTDENNVTTSPGFDEEGFCGSDGVWVCEHHWREIRNMVRFRNAVGDSPLRNWWDNGSYQIAFGRGGKGFIVINKEDYLLCETLQTGLPAGDYCDILSGDYGKGGQCSGRVITVNNVGYATFVIEPSEIPMAAIHIHSKIERPRRHNLQVGSLTEIIDVKPQISTFSMSLTN